MVEIGEKFGGDRGEARRVPRSQAGMSENSRTPQMTSMNVLKTFIEVF